MKNSFHNLHPYCMEGKIKMNHFQGYPFYPVVDNGYHKICEEKEVNPINLNKRKAMNRNEKVKAIYEKYLLDEMCGNYLDAPKAELEDE